jgi:hypothetical protein
LKGNGSIVAWGDNQYGQTVVPPPNSEFIGVAAGMWYGLGLKSISVAGDVDGDKDVDVDDLIAVILGWGLARRRRPHVQPTSTRAVPWTW